MNDQVPPIPAALRKHGITHAVHEVPPGQVVRLPAGAIFTYFKDELLERFVTGGQSLVSRTRVPPHKKRP